MEKSQQEVMSTSEIGCILKEIQAVMEVGVKSDDYVGAQNRLLYLSSMISVSATIVADAKRNLLWKKNQVITEWSNSKLPPSILSKQIDSLCWQEEAMYEEAERINKAITHAGGWLQTIISFRKTEMSLTPNQK